MLCSTCRNHIVSVGCCCTRCCGTGWGGSPQLHQSGRCVDQDGIAHPIPSEHYLIPGQIETLPTRSQEVQPLQNVLSISTAGKNRYLLHFNSLHSLTQWTAGIRLAMFEHATLQEAYTGSLIAGKGKFLNSIKTIMAQTKFKHEDWARVRFGAGTPWRRCWCVISPPDEKDVKQHQKHMRKRSAYERPTVLKGDIKFYDTMKTKKAIPIATINGAYSAYAIYPQSKPLIDQSTLVKVEGNITIHSTPETTTEGFVFVMPETHPAVSGFEIMLRWLFPLYDVFALYGRPSRLIPDTTDTRSLMFALPSERRYGYLEILDVAGLIHENGSQMWNEQEWRRQLKQLTADRLSKMQPTDSRPRSRASSMHRRHRNSLPNRANTLRFEDGASTRSNPSLHQEPAPSPPPHMPGSAPPQQASPFQLPSANRSNSHQRSVSEALPYSNPRYQRSQRSIREHDYTPSRLSYETQRDVTSDVPPPVPPPHGVPVGVERQNPSVPNHPAEMVYHDRSSSESERRYRKGADIEAQEVHQDVRPASPPVPVAAPPAFVHEPGVKPQKRPIASPEMRRANSRLSITTLSQLADAKQTANPNAAIGGIAAAGASAAWKTRSNQPDGNGSLVERSSSRDTAQSPQRDGRYTEDQGHHGVNGDYSHGRIPADLYPPSEGMVLVDASHPTGIISDSTFPTTTAQEGLNTHQSNHNSGNSNEVNRLEEMEASDPGLSRNNYRHAFPNANQVNGTDHSHTYQGFPITPDSSLKVHSQTNGPNQRHSPTISTSPYSFTNEYGSTSSHLQQTSSELYSNQQSIDTSDLSNLSHRHTLLSQLDRPETSGATFAPAERPPGAPRRHSIPRKPVPQRANSQPRPQDQPAEVEAEERSSLDSLAKHVIDEAALNQVLAYSGSRTTTMDSRVGPTTDADGSIYDDDASSKSPSYASSRPSIETKRSKKSIDPPRRGVLRTVGQVQPAEKEVVVGDAHYRPDAPKQEIETSIPLVDFGPTQAMRPTTSGGKIQQEPTPISDRQEEALGNRPKSSRQNSMQFLTDKTKDMKSGGDTGKDTMSSSTQSPQVARHRNASAQPASEVDHRRSQIWSGPTLQPNKLQQMTPEEYVKQSYLASQKPQYAVPKPKNVSKPSMGSRQSSGEFTIPQQYSRQSSASPIVSRNSSAEHVPLQHSRQGSYSRPSSALAGRPTTPSPRNTLLGRSTTPSPRLSGYYHEPPNRAASGPLINLAQNTRAPDYGPGLIHHIGAREQEKREIKDAMNQRAVQDAAQHQQRQQHIRQSSYGSQLQMPGQWPPTPTYGNQQQYGFYTPPLQYGPQFMPQQQSPTVYQQQMMAQQGQWQQSQQPQYSPGYGQPQYGQPQYGQQVSPSQQYLLSGQSAQTYFQQQPWILNGPNGPPQYRARRQQSPHVQTPQQSAPQQPQELSPRPDAASLTTATTTNKTERRASWFGKLSEQLPGGKSKDQVKK